MSIVVRYQPKPLTAEKYDATTAQLEAAGLEWLPNGMDYRICFGTDGDLMVSEIWDSRQQWQAFGERPMPILAEAGSRRRASPRCSRSTPARGVDPATGLMRRTFDRPDSHQDGLEALG